MATVIDHLTADHHVRVIQDFTDARGIKHCVAETGVLRRIDLDWANQEIFMEWERNGTRETMHFELFATQGPRNGKMREFFEVGDYAPLPRPAAKPKPVALPPMSTIPEEPIWGNPPAWWHQALALEAQDKLEAAEDVIMQGAQHIGGASSVAEMYARRMRRFQRAGDEARALEAFKQANQWISYYASLATSGGEGAALSLERDQFRSGLVDQFGYDPDPKPDAPPFTHLP